MKIVAIIITIVVLLIVLPLIVGEQIVKPAGVSSSVCIDCHNIDEIGILTTTGTSISNDYEWQKQLHMSLDNLDCLACHIIHSNELPLFQHQLLKTSVRDDCALCHIDIVPDDTIHSSAGNNCGTCHSTQSWSGAEIEHDQFFRFDSNHPSTCTNCHLVDTDFSQYSCYGECHGHTVTQIINIHGSEVQDCAECHRSARGD